MESALGCHAIVKSRAEAGGDPLVVRIGRAAAEDPFTAALTMETYSQ